VQDLNTEALAENRGEVTRDNGTQQKRQKIVDYGATHETATKTNHWSKVETSWQAASSGTEALHWHAPLV
jgi:hypothetical protein